MKSEPTIIFEVIRLAALVAGLFGIAINAEEEAALVAAVGAIIAGVSIGATIWNRLRVFSPKSAQNLRDAAYQAGAVGAPLPEVNPPGK